MNLRADLIFANERRSASKVSMRSITRIASIVGPFIAVVLILFIAMNVINLANKVKHIERTWLDVEPRKEQAFKVLGAEKVNDGILNEIETWKRSSIDWAPQLRALQEAIDPNIQLDSLRVSQVLNQNDGGITARTFKLTLTGKAVGNDAEIAVEGLQKQFVDNDAFKALVARSEIPRFGADPENKRNRIFQLDCDYKASLFK